LAIFHSGIISCSRKNFSDYTSWEIRHSADEDKAAGASVTIPPGKGQAAEEQKTKVGQKRWASGDAKG